MSKIEMDDRPELSPASATPASDPAGIEEPVPVKVEDAVAPATEPESQGPKPALGHPAEASAALTDLAAEIKALAERQDSLRELFESKIRSEENQARALERLDDQLRDYKANFVRQEMLPLLRDLIYCYDLAEDEAGRARKDSAPLPAESVARAFDHLRQMVADVLAKYDVEPYRVPGAEFDRREQQCVRTVPTGEPADDKKVAVVGATGFRLGEQIIRKEQVAVYKFAPSTAAAPEVSGAT
jgi:molecular chaperone GrpE (heat shock protein)